MRNEWIFDAVQAEVAYRTEALYKASGAGWSAGGRWWRLGRRKAEVMVPEQRRPRHDQGVLAR
jgi:hypothetical protein